MCYAFLHKITDCFQNAFAENFNNFTKKQQRKRHEKSCPYGQLDFLGLVHSLTSRFCLFLTLYARLLVSLSFAEVTDNTVSCAFTLKTSQRTVQRFVFTYSDCRHILASFSASESICFIIISKTIPFVNKNTHGYEHFLRLFTAISTYLRYL